jgi:hypothetical protein
MANRVTALLTSALMCLGACDAGDHTSAKPLAGWPHAFDAFTIVWSADPGIELTTGPAVAVRAYEEAYQLANLTGDDAYLYPGFAQAVGQHQAGDNDRHLWPNTASPATSPWVGTQHNRILSITRSDQDITVLGCMYTYAAGMQDPGDQDKRYIAQDGGRHSTADAGIEPLRITMKAPSGSESALSPQTGPARTPSTDVFGGYRITSNMGGYFVPGGLVSDWPDQQTTLSICVSQAPDPLQRRQFFTANFHAREDFPAAAPAPGWPASG